LTVESVVNDADVLCARVAELRSAGIQKLMVAEFVDGREFTVALWGNGTVEALPLTEVDFSALPPAMPRIRTYDAKWDAASPAYHATKLVQASDVPPDLQNRIERVARAAYRAFGLRDYGRVDIRVRDNTPFVIDVNAHPDITAEGSFFATAQFGGYAYSAMLDRIVRLAIARAENNSRPR
jgi:D-alanine-D-alanine ligase